MLYCPKCRLTYQDGSQRFCSNDGSRLLPALSTAPSINGNPGVFASLLHRKTESDKSELKPESAAKPASVQRPQKFAFVPPPNARFLKNEDEVSLKVEKTEDQMLSETQETEKTFIPQTKKVEKKSIPATEKIEDEISLEIESQFKPEIKNVNGAKSPTFSEIKNVSERENKNGTAAAAPKTPARMVNPLEIPSGTAEVGDRITNPLGRRAITSEKPGNLIGQLIKGRYKIVHLYGEDAKNLIYLAEDQLAENKKVVFRVFLQPNIDDLTDKTLAEERVSLSHINHPNVAALIDSGELLEGKPFIITEYVEGESVREKLQSSGAFDLRRAARIVRQAAYALSEVHQNGVLHRHLKPQNIILTVNGAGVEQIKVTDFAIADGWRTEKDFEYLAPEQLEEKPAIFAGDIYSLGVIAFQLLTNRLPFDGESEADLRRQEKQGLKLKASDLRAGIPTAVDEILEKALAYNSNERYPKARDFGDALFNAVVNLAAGTEKSLNGKSATSETAQQLLNKSTSANGKHMAAEALTSENSVASGTPRGGSRMLFPILGLILLLTGIGAIWYYFFNRPAAPAEPPVQPMVEKDAEIPNAPNQNVTLQETEEAPPPERKNILQPPNTTYFQNTRDNLTGELAKNYRGFSFFYPSDWVKTPSLKNFVDLAKTNADGVPVEQILVTFYESKGTFKADLEEFPALVKESNKKFAEQNKTYRFVSEGANEINGWKVYEMKFEAEVPAEKGEPLKLYGRRIFMPAMRDGVKTGFLITMLATSLSPDVKSPDDLGVRGNLKTILDTFEPSQAF